MSSLRRCNGKVFTQFDSEKRSTVGLTDAHVGLQDHADVVGPIPDGQRDGVLLGRLDQLHDLQGQHAGRLAPMLTRYGRLTK